MVSTIQPRDKERRSEQRRNLLFATTGSSGSSDVHPVLVRDISAHGVLVETDMNLPLGASLMLELPEAGQVAARVVWEGDKLAGCRLEDTISQTTIDTVRESGAAAHEGDTAEASVRRSATRTLANRLKQLRLERDLTRAELAELAGISTPSIWAWETGRTVPRLQSLEILAKGLGVPVSELEIGAEDEWNATDDLITDGGIEAVRPTSLDMRSQRLADLVHASKVQIAALSGTTPDRIMITIKL